MLRGQRGVTGFKEESGEAASFFTKLVPAYHSKQQLLAYLLWMGVTSIDG